MEIRKLNSLRAIAALIVMISHYSNATNIWHGALGHGAGYVGVMLFFILSGFLMTYLYLSKKFIKKNVKHFIVARIARVIPLFLLVVLISFFFHKAGIAKDIVYPIDTAQNLFAHLLLLKGDSLLWTIPPEIHFYLFFVVLWYLYSLKPTYWYIITFLICVVVIMLGFPEITLNLLGGRVQATLITFFPYYLVGTILGQTYKNGTDYFFKSNKMIIMLFSVPLLFPRIFYFLFGINLLTHNLFVFLILSLCFFSILFFVPEDNKILSNKFGDFVGKISYSLYLLHLPVLNMMESIAKGRPLLYLPCFLVICIILASVSYHLLENPSRKFIRSMF